MRALILSDIHANIDALDAVLAAAPSYDVVWNLGDLVGYNAAPNQVIDQARKLGNFFVRGNHDRACSGLDDAENFNPVAKAAVQWTRAHLESESVRWLQDLPRGPIRMGAGESSPGGEDSAPVRRDAVCVHGSLRDEGEYLLTEMEAARQPIPAGNPFVLFGHTHVQGGFARLPDGGWSALKPVYTESDKTESYPLDLRGSLVYLLNPGSVGQPRDRDWRAAFALYDDALRRITFYRVPYDVRMAQTRIGRAGLPDRLASRLSVGR